MFKYEDEIKRMREEGNTFEQIGEALNMKRQYAHYVYSRLTKRKFTDKQRKIIDTVYYPSIKKWLIDYGITLRELCDMCSEKETNSTGTPVWKFLQGKYPGNIYIIKKIMEVTGMTFEEAFKENDN